MNPVFWITYLVLAGAAVVQAALLLLQTWENRRYARSCMKHIDQQRPSGRAVVLAPCKGAEVDLRQNLRALVQQDYRDYEVRFVVEDADDPACSAIRQIMAEYPEVASRLLVAGRATNCGQKVHNLRAATADLPDEISYVVFVDSDARPRPEWLRAAIGRLDEAGATTGYRWFMPSRSSLAQHVVYSINCNVMSLMSRDNHYIVWGGSWAIRRDTFQSLAMREAWDGTLSDDLVASRVLRRAKSKVRFEPACVVASPLDASFFQAIGFIRRQYLIARHYAAPWWLLAVFAATFRNAAWLATLAVLGRAVIYGAPSPWIPAGFAVALYGLGVCRSWLVQGLARVYFPERFESLQAARRFDIWAGPLASLIQWLVLLSTLFGARIVWRSISYRLLPGGGIALLNRNDERRAALAEPVAPSAHVPAPKRRPHCQIPKSLNP
jgi:glycosyltransferase involved in cell wall biosynthesis